MPFSERAEELYVAINQDYHKQMYAFHRRNNSKERIVGWYTTTAESGQLINDNSSLIHDFYTSEYQQEHVQGGADLSTGPVHIVVDTTLSTDTLNIRGFVCTPTIVGNEVLAKTFQELQVDMQISDAEATCLHQMVHVPAEGSVMLSEVAPAQQKVEQAIEDLQRVVGDIQGYVDGVLEGKIQPSREVGIAIADALNSFAALQVQQQKQPGAAVAGLDATQNAALNTRVQDLLMVSYLTTLTQTQALVSQKLNEIL